MSGQAMTKKNLFCLRGYGFSPSRGHLSPKVLVIHADDWDRTPATTNTGEGQHHNTNSLTGIKLPLVESIESVRRVDRNTLEEVKSSNQNGVLLNSSNKLFHRLGRNAQRQSNAGREAAEVAERTAELQAKIKDYQAELKELKGNSKRSKSSKSRKTGDDAIIISASSCGRVKPATLPKRAKASEISETPTALEAPVAPVGGNYGDITEMPLATEAPALHGNDMETAFAQSSLLPDFIPSSSSLPAFDLASTSLTRSGGESNIASLDFGFDLSMFDPALAFAPELFDDFDWSTPVPPAPTAAFSSSAASLSLGWGPESHIFNWSALVPPHELPLLPPPPASSPEYSESEDPADIERAPSTAPHDINLDVNESNILHGKRMRTLSTRAADAAAQAVPSKKPHSTSLPAELSPRSIGVEHLGGGQHVLVGWEREEGLETLTSDSRHPALVECPAGRSPHRFFVTGDLAAPTQTWSSRYDACEWCDEELGWALCEAYDDEACTDDTRRVYARPSVSEAVSSRVLTLRSLV
ncbi:hypothetical protein C8J57DRAFT_1608114 [Mycena rebaudengoi]|nr:hypothetical protein C8J57DRAFT_1608114 [Mycena rebaudengoi]